MVYLQKSRFIRAFAVLQYFRNMTSEMNGLTILFLFFLIDKSSSYEVQYILHLGALV